MDPPRVAEALSALLASPNLRSREFVFRRYDQLVGSRTVRRPGLDAAVLRLRPSLRGLALTLDGQGRIARLDPFVGGALAVLEAARNVACAGGEPLGFTDCLNFGNPEKPEIGWELAEAINGMAAACDALGLPIVSGNVSLYNETNGRAIHPTPVVGAVGLVPDVRRVPKGWREGDSVLLAEASPLSLAGSEYQALFGGSAAVPGPLDLEAEATSRLLPLAGGAALLARPRLLRGRARRLSRRGGALLRLRRRAHARRRPAGALRRGRRSRGARLCAASAGGRPRARGRARRAGAAASASPGGGTLLGVELAHLRSAFEGNL